MYQARREYSKGTYPNKEEDRSYVLSKKMSEAVDVEDFVDNWCSSMYNLINGKSDKKRGQSD